MFFKNAHGLVCCQDSEFKRNGSKALIKLFIDKFGKKGISCLLADREFASGQLFKWLDSEKIYFYIRIKSNSMMRAKKKKIIGPIKALIV